MTEREEKAIQSIRNACPGIEVEGAYDKRMGQWIIRGRQAGVVLVISHAAALDRARITFLAAYYRAAKAGIIKRRM